LILKSKTITMKKIYASVILFLGVLNSNAQMLTQANHAPAIGDMFSTTDCSSVGVMPGASGTGVVWDMSGVSVGSTITNYSVIAVPSASTSAYPSASVAIKTGTMHSMYSSSPTLLKFWGGDLKISTFNANLNYSTAANTASYATVFGTTASNAVAGSVSAPPITGSFTGTCTVVADGDGVLALPTRTFSSVMRIKTTQDLALTTGVGSGTLTQVTYDYYSGLAKYPLFTISTSTAVIPFAGTSTQTVVSINSDYQAIGVNELSKDQVSLNVFPNPAKNNLTVSFNNEKGETVSCEFVNAIGQTVRKENLTNDKGVINHNLNISDLQSGVYFVKVSVGSKTSVKKLTIQ
jgi:hypothetical protein